MASDVVPHSSRQPRNEAKLRRANLRKIAEDLRLDGQSYRQIGEVVPVSTSTHKLFLAWLALLGIHNDRIVFRLHIHESADLQTALSFWSHVVGVGTSELRVTLKRHNPVTRRKNIGDDCRGCLIVYVTRSTELGRRIAGWFEGIMDRLPEGVRLPGAGVAE